MIFRQRDLVKDSITNYFFKVLRIIEKKARPTLYSLLAQYHNAICFGGLLALKQWIFCSLKHDTVPRVKNLYCFYVKKKPKQIALWVCASSECLLSISLPSLLKKTSIYSRCAMFFFFFLIYTKKEQDSPYLSLFFMTLSAIFQTYKVLRWSLNSEINSLYDK